MTKLILGLLLATSSIFAQVVIHSAEITSKEVVVRYLVPPGHTGACTHKVSYVNDFSGAYVPILDVDTTQFPGSDQDTTRNPRLTGQRARTAVFGKQIPTYQTLFVSATTNRRTSLAIEAAAKVFGKTTCGASSQTWEATTKTVPFGLTYA